MDEDHIPVSPTSSLKTKLKNSLCSYCCFRRHHLHHRGHHRQVPDSPSAIPPSSDDKPTLLWLKTRPPHHDLKDDIKDKCVNIFGRIGNGSGRHKRHPSTEFRYDPLSYALNFEDGFDDDDEYPLRNFSARLPRSQPVQTVSLKEITAFS